MKNLLILFIVFFVSGCSLYRALKFEYDSGSRQHNTPEMIAQTNRKRMQDVTEGMSKDEFLKVMGTEKIYLKGYWSYIENPYKIETTQDINNQQVEIIYYFTYDSDGNEAVSISECTPFLFKQNRLVDWGKSALGELTQFKK